MGQGNRFLYELLTAFSTARAANKAKQFTVADAMSIALQAGFNPRKYTKPFPELIHIHLNDLRLKGVLSSTTPFDRKTPVLTRVWYKP
jgi:hypothetical protein